MDGAGLVVLPEVDDEGAELILQGIHLVVVVFRVRADAVDIVFLHAVALGKALDLVHHEAAWDDDIGLRLHAPVVRVAEDHARVLDDLGDDVALRLLPGLDVRVKVGVGRAVAVDRRVSHELARQRHNLVPLKNSRKLLIHNVGDLLKIAERIHTGRAERRSLHGEVVARDRRDLEQCDALEEVKDRRRQSVTLHALPLLADKEIFVFLHRVVQIQLRVDLYAPVISAVRLFRRHFLFHSLSPCGWPS